MEEPQQKPKTQKRVEFEHAQEKHELIQKNSYIGYVKQFPKRYIVGIMAFFGFCKYIMDLAKTELDWIIHRTKGILGRKIKAVIYNCTVTHIYKAGKNGLVQILQPYLG